MTIEEIREMLSNAHYLCIDKNLIHNLSHAGSCVYTELVTRAANYKKSGKLGEDGYFFITVDDLEYECSVSRDQQTRIVKDLTERGLIAVKYAGMPRRRYIKVLNNKKAVEEAFKDTREHAEKTPLPEEVKDKYMNGFDTEIMDKEIESVAKEHAATSGLTEGVKRIYHQYIEVFGTPASAYSRRSIGNIVENALYLDYEYNIFDPEWFNELLCQYRDMNMESTEYTRSINHMLNEEIISRLQERARME